MLSVGIFAMVPLLLVLAFAAGAWAARTDARRGAALIAREKQVTIDFLNRECSTARERIRQLEHTLDEARTAALNLTPPALRDAALAGAAVAERGYDERLATELNAIDDVEHRQEYEDTIRQMRLERPSITDAEIVRTLFP